MSLQNNIQGTVRPGEVNPGYFHIYAYWPKQRQRLRRPLVLRRMGHTVRRGGLVIISGAVPDFKPMPNVQPKLGEWFCYEIMVKANTIGRNDGEVAWWIRRTVNRTDSRICFCDQSTA